MYPAPLAPTFLVRFRKLSVQSLHCPVCAEDGPRKSPCDLPQVDRLHLAFGFRGEMRSVGMSSEGIGACRWKLLTRKAAKRSFKRRKKSASNLLASFSFQRLRPSGRGRFFASRSGTECVMVAPRQKPLSAFRIVRSVPGRMEPRSGSRRWSVMRPQST